MPRYKSKERKNAEWEESSGNVYKDLGFDHNQAANLAVRSQLVVAVKSIIEENDWRREEIAEKLDTDAERFEGCIGKLTVDF